MFFTNLYENNIELPGVLYYNILMHIQQTGFIVHAFTSPDKIKIFLVGRLEQGDTFAIIEDRFKSFFYIRKSDIGQVKGHEASFGFQIRESGYRTMDEEPCVMLIFNSHNNLITYAGQLKRRGIRTYEADIKQVDQFMLRNEIHGAVHIEGEARAGTYVDHVFINPGVTPTPRIGSLSLLALDIETDVKTNGIRAVSLVGVDNAKGKTLNTVLFVGDPGTPEFEGYGDEPALLHAFAKRVMDFDPDIITGWNVIDFDFKVIAERFKVNAIPLALGRSREPAVFLDANNTRKNKVIIQGRQVIDAMWLVRSSPDKYSDYRLETVAGELLHEGKDVAESGSEKLLILDELYYDNPEAFCRYCLKDSQLVIRILEKTGLIDLTVKRCMLTGIGPDRAWTSIQPFEHLYTEHLHRRGYVAPTFGVDALPVERSKGGLILAPEPGLFDNVFVFDFKSLYPSIILTFNIDPLSFTGPSHLIKDRSALITAPNGACFKRSKGILPEIIARFFKNREDAKKDGDRIASYVYKILMNSFYGVLGTGGCRFASSYFAGAITSFGQSILNWCKDKLTDKGFHIIYGDTDSIFVDAGKPAGTDLPVLLDRAKEIAGVINTELGAYIENKYKVASALELEFEKVYKKFFIPPLRTAYFDDAARGRSKGYAGVTYEADASSEDIRPDLIEVKGMEAVRRDWTDLSHDFQRTLLDYVFHDQKDQVIKDYVQATIKKLKKGDYDAKLVYRKALRKPVRHYTKTHPPHVKAALLLDKSDQKGVIEYVMTRNGPQPAKAVSAPIDYSHYINKQLKPIAEAFMFLVSYDPDELFDESGDRYLF